MGRPVAKTLFVVGMLVLASGCATARPPAAEAIGAAEYALRKAKEDGASELAGARIREAEDKLARARAARADGDDATATRLAHEVSLEAQVAEAKAQNARIHEARDEIERSLDDLKAELERGLRRNAP